MSEIAIKVENLSKQYRLGVVGTKTLSHDLNRWWASVRGKEDPYLKIGESNDRSQKGESQYVWSLKDINFEVKQGEVLGIIGKNGAGKSTLLKILSKVTGPTMGRISAKGRIGALLEVGTGFHPELTGRENIFLNGAILGMKKNEIARKLDEIVGFSGCTRYIDTPTKRYSSGMKVRLAFAVAAFLEPEILIVDEVLAVGDAEFQKKAIGKIQDVSKGEGRTVLFVSHNMGAVMNLCNRCLLLEKGSMVLDSAPSAVVSAYLADGETEEIKSWANKAIDFQELLIASNDRLVADTISAGMPFNVLIKIDSELAFNNVILRLEILDNYDEPLILLNSRVNSQEKLSIVQGQNELECFVSKTPINIGKYRFNLRVIDNNGQDIIRASKSINVIEGPFYQTSKLPNSRYKLLCDYNWKING